MTIAFETAAYFWYATIDPGRWKRIGEKGECITVVHGELASLILKYLGIAARYAFGHDDEILHRRYSVRRGNRKC